MCRKNNNNNDWRKKERWQKQRIASTSVNNSQRPRRVKKLSFEANKFSFGKTRTILKPCYGVKRWEGAGATQVQKSYKFQFLLLNTLWHFPQGDGSLRWQQTRKTNTIKRIVQLEAGRRGKGAQSCFIYTPMAAAEATALNFICT